MARKILGVLGLALAAFIGLIAILILGGLGYRAWSQHDAARAFRITTANGIDEGRFVRIGGIEQWITIRGDDRSNPVLLYLHGGPGSAMFPGAVMRSWEHWFTIVQWDQRGAGRTYMRNPKPARGMTIDRMAGDGIEVTEFVRAKMHKPKVVLVGASWGSILGLTMIKARPDLYSAYVGGGNVVDPPRMDAFARTALIAQARARGDTKSATALETLGPPPWQQQQLGVERRILMTYAPPAEIRINQAFPGYLLRAPGYSLGDVYQFMRGMLGSQTVLVPQIEAWKAERLGRDFQVPMFFIQGTDDLQTPTSLVKDYADWVRAPRKDFVLVPGGGHTAMLSHEAFVLQVLRARVRPLAIAADAEPVTPSTASAGPRR